MFSYGFLQTKFSHLDMVGRPVVVIEKSNAVPEHNQHFQVFLLGFLNAATNIGSTSM